MACPAEAKRPIIRRIIGIVQNEPKGKEGQPSTGGIRVVGTTSQDFLAAILDTERLERESRIQPDEDKKRSSREKRIREKAEESQEMKKVAEQMEPLTRT